MEKAAKISKKLLLSYKAIPQKKQYLEFFTALLSIPVLITVAILNFNTLKNKNNSNNSPSPKQTTEKIYVPVNNGDTAKQSPVISGSNEPCKEEVGPVSILSPNEGETTEDNPVTIDIAYDDPEFCAVVWSYRINGGSWSNFDDKFIAIYNPPQGNIKLDLRVKSIVNGNQKSLSRNFIYKGKDSVPTPVPTMGLSTNSGSSSAN